MKKTVILCGTIALLLSTPAAYVSAHFDYPVPPALQAPLPVSSAAPASSDDLFTLQYPPAPIPSASTSHEILDTSMVELPTDPQLESDFSQQTSSFVSETFVFYTTPHKLNIRSGPSTNYKKIGAFPQHTRIEGQTIEETEEWIKINWKENIAYISREYLTLDAPEEILYPLTTEERELLEKVVHAESANQSFEGKKAVANVVWNRMQSASFKETSIVDIIYAPKQFSPVQDGRLEQMKPDITTKEAVAAIFDKSQLILPLDVTFFCAERVWETSWLKTRSYYTTIDDHVFFHTHAAEIAE